MILKVIGSGSKGNCYILENKTEVLILECGVHFDEVKEAMNYDLQKVCGILITHEHKDHCKGVPDALTNGMNVYATKGTIEGMAIKSHRLNAITIDRPFLLANLKSSGKSDARCKKSHADFYKTFRMWESIIYYRYLLCPQSIC